MSVASKRFTTTSFYLFSLACVPSFFLIRGIDVFNTPKAIVFFALACGTLVHLFLTKKVVDTTQNASLNRSISLLLAVLFVGMVITSLASSTTSTRVIWGYPGRANGLLYYFALFSFIYVAMRLVLERDFSTRLNRTLNFLFLVNLTYCTVQATGNDPIEWNNLSNPIVGTFGNPNFSASFLGIAAFFYLYRFLNTDGKFRIYFLVLALLATFLSIETQSIQGPILLTFATVLYVGSLLKRKLSLAAFSTLAIILIATGMSVFFSFLGIGPLGDQLYQYTLRLRMEYWLLGIKSALQWPLTGVGTDSYVEGFKLLRSPEFIETYGSGLTSDSAHNVLINFLANFGFLNFALFFVLVAIVSWRSIKLLFLSDSKDSSAVILSVIWLAMLLQSLFSIEQIGLSSFQWLAGALLLNGRFANTIKSEEEFGKDRYEKKTKGSIRSSFQEEFRGELAFITIAICLAVTYPALKQEFLLRDVSSIAAGGNISEETFVDLDSQINYIVRDEVRRGMIYVNFLLNVGRVSEAEKFLENLIEKDPQAFDALENLARIKNYFKDLSGEIKYREMLRKIVPLDPQNLLALSEAYKANGQQELSLATAKDLMLRIPTSPEVETATRIVKELETR